MSRQITFSDTRTGAGVTISATADGPTIQHERGLGLNRYFFYLHQSPVSASRAQTALGL
jgi:hypothetical protein